MDENDMKLLFLFVYEISASSKRLGRILVAWYKLTFAVNVKLSLSVIKTVGREYDLYSAYNRKDPIRASLEEMHIHVKD